jgi:hypothetical protein
MFFIYLPHAFTNLYLGYLIIFTLCRTKSDDFWKLFFFALVGLFAVYNFVEKPGIFILIFLYTPLFMGIFVFFKNYLKSRTSRLKNYKTSLNFLEFLDIHLQLGRSFQNSIGLASKNLPSECFVEIFFIKNVVVQQPKSRKCSVFHELETDLNTLSQQNLGKKELLTFTKDKFLLNYELEQKIQISSSQYKAQSYTLIFFWLVTFLWHIKQGSHLNYSKTILISFLLMLLGLMLSKKLLMKTHFRI